MTIASVRYLELQRALQSALRTHLPPPQHGRSGRKTRRQQSPPPRRRFFVANLLQLLKQGKNPCLVGTPGCLCSAGSLLHASLQLMESAAEQHGTHLVVIFAMMQATCPRPMHGDAALTQVLPLVFFFRPPSTTAARQKKTLVSSLPLCYIATPSGAVVDHHASLQVFLMAYTALDLHGCMDHSCVAPGRAEAVTIRVTVQQVWHTDGRHLFLHCLKQRHTRRRRRGMAAQTTRVVVTDPGLGGSCVVHRSWEHLSANLVITPANLAFMCTNCQVRGNNGTHCELCRQPVADMSTFCFIYTWSNRYAKTTTDARPWPNGTTNSMPR